MHRKNCARMPHRLDPPSSCAQVDVREQGSWVLRSGVDFLYGCDLARAAIDLQSTEYGAVRKPQPSCSDFLGGIIDTSSGAAVAEIGRRVGVSDGSLRLRDFAFCIVYALL